MPSKDYGSAAERLVRAADVLTGTGINTQHFALFDKQRYAYGRAGAQDRRLGAALCSIALQTRIGFNHFQFHEVRRRNADRVIVPQGDDALVLLLQPFGCIAYGVGVSGKLLERVRVHEVPHFTIVVEVLHVQIHHVSAFNAFVGLEGTFPDAASQQVTQTYTGEGLALARLDEFNIDHAARVAIDHHFHAVFELVAGVVSHK